MTTLTNSFSSQPCLSTFTMMRLDSSIISQGVMDIEEQYQWHDNDMHSDRDELEYLSVKDVHIELAR